MIKWLMINKMFQNLVEETMQVTQARVYLYGMTTEGYSARAFSSVDAENFHSVMNVMDHRGVQQSSIYELKRTLSHLSAMMVAKKFTQFESIFCSRTENYPAPQLGHGLAQILSIKDCDFDKNKGSKKNKEVNPKVLNGPPRGALGTRATGGHKRNEEK